MPSKSNLGEANRKQRCLTYVRHDNNKTLFCHFEHAVEKSTHTHLRYFTFVQYDKYAIICYPQSTDPLPCGTPPDSGGEFLVCICTTCDLSLLVLSKLFAFALNFNPTSWAWTLAALAVKAQVNLTLVRLHELSSLTPLRGLEPWLRSL